MIALRLAREGYWGGDIGKVMQAPVNEVMAALQYEVFRQEYEAAFVALNKEKA